MKKVLLVLASLVLTVSLCACSSQKNNSDSIPAIDPAALVTVEDIAANAGYTPVIEASETTRDGNTATVMYRSEPIGQNDIVRVTVTQFTDQIDSQQLYAKFSQDREARPLAETVPAIGHDAFIAFPSIHVFDRGCIIEITAGSGSGETQRNMLKSLALTAAQRIEAIMPEGAENN